MRRDRTLLNLRIALSEPRDCLISGEDLPLLGYKLSDHLPKQEAHWFVVSRQQPTSFLRLRDAVG
jgi:hypothetical protein